MSTTPTERAQWLEQRRSGLGGTDAAAILGLSKWANAHDVWLDKRKLVGEQPETEQMWWGRKLEALIAERYEMATGRAVWNPHTLYRHPQHECLIGTPDRLVVGERRGLEIKTASTFMADEWGPAGGDDIPPAYVVQCLHYMAVSGFPSWDVAVLIGGSDFRVYTVRRNEALERSIVERLTEWWAHHVVEGVEPEVTDSPATRRWLAEKFPFDRAPMLTADPRAEGLAARLNAARAVIDSAEVEKDSAEVALKAIIGDAVGIEGRDWRATWKRAKDSNVTDWQAVARALADDLVRSNDGYGGPEVYLDPLVEKHTEVRPGSRRFLFKPRTE